MDICTPEQIASQNFCCMFADMTNGFLFNNASTGIGDGLFAGCSDNPQECDCDPGWSMVELAHTMGSAGAGGTIQCCFNNTEITSLTLSPINEYQFTGNLNGENGFTTIDSLLYLDLGNQNFTPWSVAGEGRGYYRLFAQTPNHTLKFCDAFGEDFGINFMMQWPKATIREKGSEGFQANQYKAVWGVRPKISTTSVLHDVDYTDYMRRLPMNYATQMWSPTNTEGFKYSTVFTLDDLVVNTSTNEVTYVSGSRHGGTSYTATSGSKQLLSKGVKKWRMPIFGGFDGLNIKYVEPFADGLIDSTVSDAYSYVNYSLNRALDSVADSEVSPANLILMPGIRNSNITSRMLNIAETRQDVLAIIDLAGDYVPRFERKAGVSEIDSVGSVSDVISNLKTRNINSSYGCCFFPWVQATDALNNNAIVWLPPSVAALGGMAQSQAASDVWFAPAGFNRGGLGNGSAGLSVVNVIEKLTATQRDNLYETNINPIASFPAEGLVVFGQKTLQATPSALDRINVRRLMIFLKKQIRLIANNILFDPNEQVTWNRFLNQVNPFLASIKNRFGLSDYRVVLDSSTTTPDLVDRNIMYAKIFLKPTRAIEFIAIDFNISNTGAAFAD